MVSVFKLIIHIFLILILVLENGMLLRSGHSLKNKKTMEERFKTRRSLMSGKEYETMSSNSNSRYSDKNLVNSEIKSRNRRSLLSNSEYNSLSGTNNSRGQQRSNLGTNSNHTTEVVTVKRTLMEEFNEDKDDMTEKGMKEASSSKKKSKRKSAVINHMYGKFVRYYSSLRS